MLAKLTFDNQLTLPDVLISEFKGVEYFDVAHEDGSIVLTPTQATHADAVRSKLEDLGISESDVADAVAWARRR